MKKRNVAVLIGVFVGVAAALCMTLSCRDTSVDTSGVRKEVRFYKELDSWYADVPQHTQAENRTVAGADALLDDVAGGRSKVSVVVSPDVEDPGAWNMHLHLVEHDRIGATYKVTTAGDSSTRMAWLCNVMHTVFGGEHPTDIYGHSIKVE